MHQMAQADQAGIYDYPEYFRSAHDELQEELLMRRHQYINSLHHQVSFGAPYMTVEERMRQRREPMDELAINAQTSVPLKRDAFIQSPSKKE